MSYGYPPHGTPGATYPYAQYHAQTPGAYTHSQAAGAYPTAQYQPYAPATAVTSYGAAWPYYGHSYYQHQQPQQAHAPASAPRTATPSTSTTTGTAAQGSAAVASTTAAGTAAAAATPAPVTAAASAVAAATAARATVPSTYTFTSYNREAPYGRGGKKGSSYRGLFTKELRNLMYGFGDDRNPASDTVNVMEEILIEYIVDVVLTASGPGKKSRLSIEDIRRALSRPADAKKLARMEELLFMQEDIKRARAQFDEPDMHPEGSGHGH